MFTKEDLLARLQNGDTAEELADEFIAAMNEAETEYAETEKAAAEEAKREAEKLVDAEAVAEAIHTFFMKWYPDEASQDAALTGDQIISLLESTIETRKMMSNLIKEVEEIDMSDVFRRKTPFTIFKC